MEMYYKSKMQWQASRYHAKKMQWQDGIGTKKKVNPMATKLMPYQKSKYNGRQVDVILEK